MSPLVLKVPMIVSDFVNEDTDDITDIETFNYQVIGYFFFNPAEVITIHQSEMLLNGEMTNYSVINLKSEETIRVVMTPEDFLRTVIQSFNDKGNPVQFDKSIFN